MLAETIQRKRENEDAAIWKLYSEEATLAETDAILKEAESDFQSERDEIEEAKVLALEKWIERDIVALTVEWKRQVILSVQRFFLDKNLRKAGLEYVKFI